MVMRNHGPSAVHTEIQRAGNTSTFAEPALKPPTGVNTSIGVKQIITQHEDELIRQYRVGETQTPEWYERRIHVLVDEIYRLESLLDTHNIPHKKTRN